MKLWHIGLADKAGANLELSLGGSASALLLLHSVPEPGTYSANCPIAIAKVKE